MKKIILFLIAGMLTFNAQVYFTASAEENGIEIYVNPLADSGDGSFEKPFKTLEEAKTAARNIKKSGYPNGGIKIYLRGGNYNLNDTFKLSAEDSGESGAPVTWEAYNNETVNITGGARLKLSEFQIADNSTIDESVRGKVYACNLREKGINGYDTLHITGHAQYYLLKFGLITDGDTVEFGTANPEIIFENDVVGRLAQYPNDGYMTIERVIDPGDRPARWGESEESSLYVPMEERNYPPKPPVFSVNDERVKKWGNAKYAWVKGYWYYDWSDQSMGVEKIDAEQGIIYPSDPSGYSAQAGQRFFIFNLLEELDAPGEWYYDFDTGILYVYPPSTNPESEMMLSFASNNIIEIDGAENIVFKDLNIAGTRDSGIVCTGCKNVDILYCEISNISGEAGIKYSDAENCRVIGCHVYNMGARCISMDGGSRITLKPGNNLIQNCWLHNFGRLLKTYAGGITLAGVGNTARNNLIYDGSHLGIQMSGNDQLVENNDIYSVMKEAADMGAVYTGRNMTARGNVIRNNAIHDLYSDSDAEGKYAVYLDDSQCGYTVENNFMFNIDDRGVFINGGRNNTIRNNIFANITDTSVLISDQARAFNNNKGIFDESYFGLEGIPFEGEAYSKYPNMNNLREDEPLTPKYNVVENNVNYNVPKEITISLHPTAGSTMTTAEMKEKNTLKEGYSTTADPGFLALEQGNYELSLNSKVFEELEGFENISMDKIGLITSRLKENLSQDAVVLKEGTRKTYKNWNRDILGEDILAPFEENGKIYIPLRYICESLDIDVNYENNMIVFNNEGGEIKISGDNSAALIDGESFELEETVKIIEDRAYMNVQDFENLFSRKSLIKDGIIIIAPDDAIKKIDNDMIEDLILRM